MKSVIELIEVSKNAKFHIALAFLLGALTSIFVLYCGLVDVWGGISDKKPLLFVIGIFEVFAVKPAGLFVLGFYARMWSMWSK